MRKLSLSDYGYPYEGIVIIDHGGGDGYEYPQEAFTPRDCGSCRLFDSKEYVCMKTGDDKDPYDTCDDIDYKEEWEDSEGGYREPVRHEYSSDKAYEQACKAIKAINRDILKNRERDW